VKLNRASGIATLDVAFQTAAVADADKEVAALKDRVKKGERSNCRHEEEAATESTKP